MNKAERVALADAAIAAEKGGEPLTFVAPAPAAGDTPTPSASDKPATEAVTPTPAEAGTPQEVVAPEVSTATAGATDAVVFPTWVPERSKEALRSLSKDSRDAVLADMDARRVSLERDATEKWMKAKEVEGAASKWNALVSDPVKGPRVLEILEATVTPAVDPRLAKLAEVLGDDAAAAIVDMVGAKASEVSSKIIHEKVEAPVEHIDHVNKAASVVAKQLGLSDVEYAEARRVVGVKLGWTPDDQDAPYRTLTTENVGLYLAFAADIVRATPKAPAAAASLPKPQVAKPASPQSNGMTIDTKQDPPWVREQRPAKYGERSAWTMRKAGVSEADVERAMRNM